ncbi:MAG: hypothetical protein LQ348_004100 [Seirophora lacunosa]|nr:MAG: hypothetical protein LQ344_003516 [Seirophora lacunosa]KAI4187340.1 MAG: hypothetical protein LQ348_004100 [Seirophora lacunosa]
MPDYPALSYSWGTEDHTETVPFDDQELMVTPNLYAALSEISLNGAFSDSWFWIDAICINQDNAEDKAVEVKRMNVIFANARSVLIWLGPAADDSDVAMEFLAGLNKILTLEPKDPEIIQHIRRTTAPIMDSSWNAITKLYERRWFRRLWVIQEVALARHALVQCGKKILPWSVFTDASASFFATYEDVLQHFNAVNCVSSCLMMKRMAMRVPFRGFTEFVFFLNYCTLKEATNQLDHIYGLLGLAADNIRQVIPVDYTWTAAQCFTQCCKVLLERESSLLLLSVASSPYRNPQLPTGCPDLSQWTFEILPKNFKAGYTSLSTRRSMIKVCDDSNALKVPGFRVDIVREVVQGGYGDVFTLDKAKNSAAASSNLALESQSLTLFSEVYSMEESNLEAYYRTLIANHFEHAVPVPSDQTLRDQYTYMKQFWVELSERQPSERPLSEPKSGMLRYAQGIEAQKFHRFFNTKGGRIGLGPRKLQPGDVICVFYSAGPLFALRFDETGEKAELVGDTYMHGLMDLETTPDDARGVDEWFCII